MKNLNYFIVSFTALLIFSCVRDAKNIVIPESASILGVSCFLSPEDSVIMVTLSRSQPLNLYPEESKIKALKESMVEVSDGQNTQVIPFQKLDYDNNPVFYINAELFPITPGKTYYLTVKATTGEILTANTTIPLNTNTSMDYKISSKDTISSGGYFDLPVFLEFFDLPETDNYYKAGLKTQLNSPDCGYTGAVDFQSDLISDKNNNGRSFKINDVMIFASCKPKSNDSLSLILANVDYNYYMFMKGLESNNQENPFSEPSPVFSNVQGGFGVFCSYRVHVKKLAFRYED